jgi:hypothetical protein
VKRLLLLSNTWHDQIHLGALLEKQFMVTFLVSVS